MFFRKALKDRIQYLEDEIEYRQSVEKINQEFIDNLCYEINVYEKFIKTLYDYFKDYRTFVKKHEYRIDQAKTNDFFKNMRKLFNEYQKKLRIFKIFNEDIGEIK